MSLFSKKAKANREAKGSRIGGASGALSTFKCPRGVSLRVALTRLFLARGPLRKNGLMRGAGNSVLSAHRST